MDEERQSAGFPRWERLIEKFRDKEYRDSYVASHTRRFLARQMRKFRGEQSQSDFGETIGKPQTIVSRLEDPGYGPKTLQTMFETAARLNVAVIARFVDFPTFLKLTDDMSDEAFLPQPYSEQELRKIERLPVTQGQAAAAFAQVLTGQHQMSSLYGSAVANENEVQKEAQKRLSQVAL
jgi:hypothetical protein